MHFLFFLVRFVGELVVMSLYCSLLQAHETAKSVCSNLGKPSAANAHTLSSLFPSQQPVKRIRSDVFDPLADCVASAAKRKKKAVRIKPRKVTVVCVDDTNAVPCFGKRKALKNQGKMRQLQFLRNMSAEQVQKNIFHGFSDKVDDGKEFCIKFLQPDPRTHTLTKVDRVNFDGGDVQRDSRRRYNFNIFTLWPISQ